MSTSPLQQLELRALEQRNRMHQVITDAKLQVEITKEKLDIKRHIKTHMLLAALAAGVLGMTLGYGAASVFTDKR